MGSTIRKIKRECRDFCPKFFFLSETKSNDSDIKILARKIQELCCETCNWSCRGTNYFFEMRT